MYCAYLWNSYFLTLSDTQLGKTSFSHEVSDFGVKPQIIGFCIYSLKNTLFGTALLKRNIFLVKISICFGFTFQFLPHLTVFKQKKAMVHGLPDVDRITVEIILRTKL